MKSALLKLVGDKTRNHIVKTYRKYLEYKDSTIDLCAVWMDRDHIKYETSLTKGSVPKGKDAGIFIRKTIGQNILMTFGLPISNEYIITVVLLPFPSLLLGLGYKEYYKFIKDWPGNSCVAEIEVARYSVLK